MAAESAGFGKRAQPAASSAAVGRSARDRQAPAGTTTRRLARRRRVIRAASSARCALGGLPGAARPRSQRVELRFERRRRAPGQQPRIGPRHVAQIRRQGRRRRTNVASGVSLFDSAASASCWAAPSGRLEQLVARDFDSFCGKVPTICGRSLSIERCHATPAGLPLARPAGQAVRLRRSFQRKHHRDRQSLAVPGLRRHVARVPVAAMKCHHRLDQRKPKPGAGFGPAFVQPDEALDHFLVFIRRDTGAVDRRPTGTASCSLGSAQTRDLPAFAHRHI